MSDADELNAYRRRKEADRAAWTAALCRATAKLIDEPTKKQDPAVFLDYEIDYLLLEAANSTTRWW